MVRPETTDHSHDSRVELAAQWIVETPRDQIVGSLIAAIQERFGIDPKGACATRAMAESIRAGGAK